MTGSNEPLISYGVISGDLQNEKQLFLAKSLDTFGSSWNSPLLISNGKLINFSSLILLFRRRKIENLKN